MSTRRASHRTFLAQDWQAPSAEVPGPQPPSLAHWPVGPALEQPEWFRQKRPNERWDYFKGLLFLKAAFPVSLPDPCGDLLSASKFAPKQEKLPSETRLWKKVKLGLTPRPCRPPAYTHMGGLLPCLLLPLRPRLAGTAALPAPRDRRD